MRRDQVYARFGGPNWLVQFPKVLQAFSNIVPQHVRVRFHELCAMVSENISADEY